MSARTGGSTRWALVVLSLVAAVACGDDRSSGGPDGGQMDAGPFDAGPPPPCTADGDCPGSYCAPATRPGATRTCCVPLPYEICGDRIDQNCDHADEPCGDNDGDGTQACHPGEEPIGSGCDCDDTRADVRPPFGSVAGAMEACDGVDNDCNGRIDESSACCDACASLGANRDRADICTLEGVCDCTSDPGSGPCPEGLTCCGGGCVDVTNDIENCGFCGAACTVSSDHCVGRTCACGDGPPCDLDTACTGGTCAGG